MWDLTRLPAVGNHEYRTPGAYFDYFGASAGDPTKGSHSYDVGSWHEGESFTDSGTGQCHGKP